MLFVSGLSLSFSCHSLSLFNILFLPLLVSLFYSFSLSAYFFFTFSSDRPDDIWSEPIARSHDSAIPIATLPMPAHYIHASMQGLWTLLQEAFFLCVCVCAYVYECVCVCALAVRVS